ncbi:MAG: hypothetical protein Q7R87_04795 [Nanoarchaeota archaeon]|nr:hypothetical protein [Nanoarchaeota archaeon]
MEKRTKRGELEMEYVIIAIILIVGFIALAYFLISLDITSVGEDAACKLSILAKATAPGLWIVDPKPSIPIECVTKKICLGGEKCTSNFEGEKNIDEVKLDIKDENKSKMKIEETVANAFYNCWDDFGTGKFDIFGSHEDAKPRCVVCSRIVLDKSIPLEITKKIDVNTYLRTKKAPNSELNYMQAMGLTKQITKEVSKEVTEATAEASGFGKFEDSVRGTNELAVVFMQVSAESGGESAIEWISGATGLGVLGGYGVYKSEFIRRQIFRPDWKVVQAAVTGRAGAGKVVMTNVKNIGARSGLLAILFGSFIAFDEVNAWADRVVVASYCGTYQNGKGSEGCSVVRILPYTQSSINGMCDVLEAEA